jgi:hypothetical protein
MDYLNSSDERTVSLALRKLPARAKGRLGTVFINPVSYLPTLWIGDSTHKLKSGRSWWVWHRGSAQRRSHGV